ARQQLAQALAQLSCALVGLIGTFGKFSGPFFGVIRTGGEVGGTFGRFLGLAVDLTEADEDLVEVLVGGFLCGGLPDLLEGAADELADDVAVGVVVVGDQQGVGGVLGLPGW